MDYEKIGQRIRKYRKSKNFSQEQLAEKIGISPTHMSHIETGSTKLSLPVLVDLSEMLEVKTDNLLFDEKSVSDFKLQELIAQCNEAQIDIITSIIKSVKTSLDKYF
ncbi:MAG: helix-turn-helix transcriptional regulator [Treponema sp.]|nr:helix-turn-helix transcriptional regulator [Treponema sp.]